MNERMPTENMMKQAANDAALSQRIQMMMFEELDKPPHRRNFALLAGNIISEVRNDGRDMKAELEAALEALPNQSDKGSPTSDDASKGEN